MEDREIEPLAASLDRREVGGAKKSFTQVKDIPDSFIAADGIETGVGNKIPLWLLGFIY